MPGQDEIRWPEVSEPAELFPAAATRVGGHGLDEPDGGGGAASGGAGAGVGGGLKDIDDDEYLSPGAGGYSRSEGHTLSDPHGPSGYPQMSDNGHSVTTGWSSNAAGVGTAAAAGGAAGGAAYNASHDYPQTPYSDYAPNDHYGQQPQTYEAPRHMSYVGSQGGHEWADYESAYGQGQQQQPYGNERMSHLYEGIDDETGSIADCRESVQSGGGGRLGVVNL